MTIRFIYQLWLSLLEFSDAVWGFFGQPAGSFVWDFITGPLVPDFLSFLLTSPLNAIAALNGYSSGEVVVCLLFNYFTIFEVIFGPAIILILGYRFASWVLDLLP